MRGSWGSCQGRLDSAFWYLSVYFCTISLTRRPCLLFVSQNESRQCSYCRTDKLMFQEMVMMLFSPGPTRGVNYSVVISSHRRNVARTTIKLHESRPGTTNTPISTTKLENMDIPPSQIKPIYNPNSATAQESPSIQSRLTNHNFQPHPEGGYYKETHRSSQQIPNPFQSTTDKAEDEKNNTRAASSSIQYLLTPGSPLGAFHRNLAHTVHTWHAGRGRYIVIYPDEVKGGNWGGRAQIETFLVGPDAGRGECQEWVVEGGKYKGSFLLPDSPGCGKEDATEGLLISEVCNLFTCLKCRKDY